jgi:glyoxylase-like metal-dependent hydrolase (beta-lactamase superfamily II)
VELAPGIHYLGGRKGGYVRAFLIEHRDELTLIDTLYDEDAHDVLAAMQRLGRKASDLKRIVITHAHRSHLGGLAALKQWSGAKVLSHEWEADIISGNREAQRVSILPRLPLRAWMPFQVGLALGRGKHPPCPVDETLTEEDEVGGLQVLHIPGHTPGHLGFYSPERQVLISGDAIATWPRFEDGWPAFTLDPQRHTVSIARMAALEPKVVGVGHGDPITRNAADKLHGLAERKAE